MRRKRVLVVALATILTTYVHGTAWALDRVSGTLTRTFTIVDNTELVGDVICDVTGAPCFTFGVSDVELRLNGFSITGKADPVTGCDGAAFAGEMGIITNGARNVVVRGPGLVQRFRADGIFVTGSTSVRIELVTASTNCMSGIRVAANSFDTIVQDNVAVRNGASQAGLSCGGI
jgi:hypothetical protein